MKKIRDFIKPYLLIIFGTLFLLLYSDLLDGGTGEIIFGVFAILFAVFYVTVGVIKIAAANKVKDGVRNVLDFLAYTLFPFFMFAYGIFALIDKFDFFDVNIIIIWFLIIVSALLLMIFQGFVKLGKATNCARFVFLFDALFVISMALMTLFQKWNMALLAITIGFVIEVIFIASFAFILLDNKEEDKPKENADKPKPAKAKAAKEPKEEEPKEEAAAAE